MIVQFVKYVSCCDEPGLLVPVYRSVHVDPPTLPRSIGDQHRMRPALLRRISTRR